MKSELPSSTVSHLSHTLLLFFSFLWWAKEIFVPFSTRILNPNAPSSSYTYILLSPFSFFHSLQRSKMFFIFFFFIIKYKVYNIRPTILLDVTFSYLLLNSVKDVLNLVSTPMNNQTYWFTTIQLFIIKDNPLSHEIKYNKNTVPYFLINIINFAINIYFNWNFKHTRYSKKYSYKKPYRKTF